MKAKTVLKASLVALAIGSTALVSVGCEQNPLDPVTSPYQQNTTGIYTTDNYYSPGNNQGNQPGNQNQGNQYNGDTNTVLLH